MRPHKPSVPLFSAIPFAVAPSLPKTTMTVSVKNQKSSAVKKSTKGKQKAEKVFHPESRKAGQMERKNLRKQKLTNQVSKRSKKQMAQGM